MKTVPRSPWITLHRYLGLVALPFLFLAALTGAMLSFVRPIDHWLNADLFVQERVADDAPDVTMILDRFAARHPEWIVLDAPLRVGGGQRIPVKVEAVPGKDLPDYDQLFLDRTSGEIAAGRSTHAAFTRAGFAEWLIELHAHLLLDTGGRWFMGIIAGAWLIGHCIGFYLTFPLRGSFWKGWKRSWKVAFRGALSKPGFGRFMLDWHKASALWLFVPLTALALTSVALNFFAEAYAPAVEALFGEDAPAAAAGPAKDAPLDFAGAVRLAARHARAQGSDWQPATVQYDPAEDSIGVRLTDDGLLNYHLLGPVYYYFDRKSHALVETYDPYGDDRTLAAYRVLYPLHSGRVGGNLTILLVFLSGLATAGLCVTGGYVWWKKRRSRIAAHDAARRRKMARRCVGRD